MIKVGLTGNIGSGKSVVARIFSTLGVPVYHADEESKKFFDDETVRLKIAEKFGNSIIHPDGSINRRSLASIVFKDRAALLTLNEILHPLVRDSFMRWSLLRKDTPYVIMEAAIIYETGYEVDFDRMIHVSAPRAIAISRVMKRDGISEADVLLRMQNQLPDDQKSRAADFVILNDGSELLIPQVLTIHSALRE